MQMINFLVVIFFIILIYLYYYFTKSCKQCNPNLKILYNNGVTNNNTNNINTNKQNIIKVNNISILRTLYIENSQDHLFITYNNKVITSDDLNLLFNVNGLNVIIISRPTGTCLQLIIKAYGAFNTAVTTLYSEALMRFIEDNSMPDSIYVFANRGPFLTYLSNDVRDFMIKLGAKRINTINDMERMNYVFIGTLPNDIYYERQSVELIKTNIF